MSETVDIAVFGSTPLARLLAGLLSETQGKRVALIGDTSATYRLAHGIDLSVAPITRPDLWALLGAVVPETLKLLGRVSGRNGFSRVDPVFLAASPTARQGLAHMRQMAAAFGHDIQRLPEDIAGAGREGVIMRDAVVINRAGIEADLDEFLRKAKVIVLDSRTATVTLAGHGASIASGERQLTAELAVIADDEAALAYLDHAQLAPAFAVERAINVLTEPTKMRHGPVVLDVDTGLAVLQRPSLGVSAIAPGGPAQVLPLIGTLLVQQVQLRQAGQITFDRLAAHDGAPRIGPIRENGPVLIAGFGSIGAFLVPAIARWIAGKAMGSERQTLDLRRFIRPADAPSVADYRPAGTAEAAA